MNERPLVVIGHRGAMSVAPENTMASFVAARDLGAGGVELDVHRSRDGRIVVHHDYTLERTTDGTGPIFERDWAEIEALDAGGWFRARRTGVWARRRPALNERCCSRGFSR